MARWLSANGLWVRRCGVPVVLALVVVAVVTFSSTSSGKHAERAPLSVTGDNVVVPFPTAAAAKAGALSRPAYDGGAGVPGNTGKGRVLLAEFQQMTDISTRSTFNNAGPPPAEQATRAIAVQRGLFHFGRKGPIFPPAMFPQLAVLLTRWEDMREEALRVKYDSQLVRQHPHFAHPSSIELLERILEQGNVGWVTVGWIPDRDWQNYGLVMHDHVLPGITEQLCPTTVALLKEVPGVRLAGFSKLTPNAHIVPHTDYAGLGQRSVVFHVYLTGHARMRINNEWVEHIPGHMFVFDSNADHEVINGPEERIILYGELDPEIFLWKTEGLDLRNSRVPAN